jgi:predicted AAA+ superfamily ATPase
MIANPCYNATDPNVGLAMSGDHSTQKLYFGDTGLLVTQAMSEGRFSGNELYRAILLDKLSVNEGMLMENIVAQSLRANGHRLFFYSRYDSVNRENMMEVDFLIGRDRRISPLEVKSSGYTSHSSLSKFRRKFAPIIGDPFILYQKDVMVRDGVTHLPLCMAMLL